MKKKILLFLLCLFVTAGLQGCTHSQRFGMQELSRRLGKQNESYAFSIEGASLSNGFFHIPLSLQQENDLLLSCKEDADGQLLQVLLTAAKDTAPTQDFLSLSRCLTAVFFCTGTQKADSLLQTVGLTGEEVLFSDHTESTREGRYSMTFYSTQMSVTLLLCYDDAVMLP